MKQNIGSYKWFVIVILLGLAGLLFSLYLRPSENNIIIINNHKIEVEIADTKVKREKGLSGRPSLDEDSGMLFVFDKPGKYPFWMKDMQFALDFVWIMNDIVVEITKNISSSDYQPSNTIAPKQEVNKVLELNAGISDKLNIKVGDSVKEISK